MTPSKRFIFAATLAFGVCPAHADTHCGMNAGNAPAVKMWETDAKQRKTTRELVVSIRLSRHLYRACKENGLTVILQLADRRSVDTVYFVKD